MAEMYGEGDGRRPRLTRWDGLSEVICSRQGPNQEVRAEKLDPFRRSRLHLSPSFIQNYCHWPFLINCLSSPSSFFQIVKSTSTILNSMNRKTPYDKWEKQTTCPLLRRLRTVVPRDLAFCQLSETTALYNRSLGEAHKHVDIVRREPMTRELEISDGTCRLAA